MITEKVTHYLDRITFLSLILLSTFAVLVTVLVERLMVHFTARTWDLVFSVQNVMLNFLRYALFF